MSATTLSSKGQVILPRAVREARRLKPGARFAVEDTAEGILLRPLKPFAPTRFEDVRGCLRYRGKPKSIAEMNAGILAEAKRRHARGRY